jgi:hypothetical protein
MAKRRTAKRKTKRKNLLRGTCGASARKVAGGWALYTSVGFKMPYAPSSFRSTKEVLKALREVCAEGHPRASASTMREHDRDVVAYWRKHGTGPPGREWG